MPVVLEMKTIKDELWVKVSMNNLTSPISLYTEKELIYMRERLKDALIAEAIEAMRKLAP